MRIAEFKISEVSFLEIALLRRFTTFLGRLNKASCFDIFVPKFNDMMRSDGEVLLLHD